MVLGRRARGSWRRRVAGVFGCAGERDVYLFLCEVLGLEEGDALVERRAGDRRVLQDCDVG